MQIDFLTVLNCCLAKNFCTSGKLISVFDYSHIPFLPSSYIFWIYRTWVLWFLW